MLHDLLGAVDGALLALIVLVVVAGAVILRLFYGAHQRRRQHLARRQLYRAKAEIEQVLTEGTARYTAAEQALETAAAALAEQDIGTVRTQLGRIEDLLVEEKSVEGVVEATLAKEMDEVVDAGAASDPVEEATVEEDVIETEEVEVGGVQDDEGVEDDGTEMGQAVEEDVLEEEAIDLAEMTVGDIQLLVEEGALTPREAFDRERRGRNRRTLMSWLEDQLPEEEQHDLLAGAEDLEWDWRIAERRIDEVQELVREGVVLPHRALDVERAGRQRETLIEWLERRVAEEIEPTQNE